MSTLKVNTVQHNTSGFNNVVQFTDGAGTQNGTLCRAWVNFDGEGTIAIRADFNVNSLTDNGTGDYSVTFDNAMTDTNYATCASISNNSGTSQLICCIYQGTGNVPTTPSTSTFRIHTSANTGEAKQDAKFVCVSVFR